MHYLFQWLTVLTIAFLYIIYHLTVKMCPSQVPKHLGSLATVFEKLINVDKPHDTFLFNPNSKWKLLICKKKAKLQPWEMEVPIILKVLSVLKSGNLYGRLICSSFISLLIKVASYWKRFDRWVNLWITTFTKFLWQHLYRNICSVCIFNFKNENTVIYFCF